MFTLINAVVGTTIDIIQLVLGLEFLLLSLIYLAATITLVIALCVRRLHGTDRSDAWALPYLVPIISWLVLFVFACLEGNPDNNRHGSDPRFGSS